MSKSRNASKPKPAKPAASSAILDKRAKRLRDWQDEIVNPFLEALETRSDAINGEVMGLCAVRDGNQVLGFDPKSKAEVVVALRGGLKEDLRRNKTERAEMDRGAHDPGEAARKRNVDELAKIERQIAAINEQEKKLIAEKVAIDDMIRRILLAIRRHGGVRCVRRAAESVRPSAESLSALIQDRSDAVDEKVETESGDKSQPEGNAVIESSVDRSGRKAQFDMSASLDADSDIRDIRLLYVSQHDPESNRLIDRTPAFELLCAIFPNEVKAHLKARLAKYHKENGPALSADERAAKVKQLRKKIFDLDWQIAAQVQALNAIGKPAIYPRKISVWAVLGLQPQKEVRQYRDRIGREEEL